ncbi:MAG: hypothetical protein NTY15_14495 [Planctomycetota bacterium]|nr:hypothetical protein [Planctomycetota bacterium]
MKRAFRVLFPTFFILGCVAPTCFEFGCITPAQADDKKNEAARVTATEPVVLVCGAKTALKVRGFKLKEATELRLPSATQVKAEIKEKKDAVQPKGLENKEVGDTQLLAELTLPIDHPPGILEYVIETPAGHASGKILVFPPDAVIDESEPNNGFREAQKLQPGQSASGRIQADKDVDVYAYQIIAGQQYKVTVTSGGSLILDAELHCYRGKNQLLAAADDAQSRDPVLTLKSPVDEVVFLCVSSAHDIGGEWHSYLLTVEEVK